jgi:peptidoglycan/xylan/chitin deacetylase (PgdA/CDA1 family)
MNITKKLARNVVFPVLINLGLEKKWRDRSNHTILNILYHGVVEKNNLAFSPRHISRDQFIQHLKYLTREFDIISLEKAFENYRTKRPLKRKTITVSFDDGYLNNLDVAMPLLEEFNVPTTFFISSVCTQEMEVRALWTDVIACLNYFHHNEAIAIDGLDFINMLYQPERLHLLEYLKGKSPSDRDQLVNELIQKYDLISKINQIPEELWKLQTGDELKKFASSPVVTLGSHGHMHYNLGQVSVEDATKELKTSKALLEETTQKEISMIAYPDGSYSNEVKDIAERLGYDKQLAVRYQCADDSTDLRILPRFGVAVTTTYESNMFFINKSFNTLGFN